MARANEKIKVKCAVISHIGNLRSNNEDNFFLNGDMMRMEEVNGGAAVTYEGAAETHLFGVCDGMGGLEGGERASLIAVQGLNKLVDLQGRPFPLAADAVMREISRAVERDGEENGKKQKEGTTAAVLHLTRQAAWAANVGDSRVYLLQNGHLKQITQDHSPIYQMMLEGKLTREQARKHPQSNAISHYLGMPADRQSRDFVFVRQLRIAQGDRLMICSDGLSDLVSHPRMEELLSRGETMDACRALVSEALILGGKDNVTVMVIDPVGYTVAGPNLIDSETVTD